MTWRGALTACRVHSLGPAVRGLSFAVVLLALPVRARGQQSLADPTVEAMRRRDAGDLQGAIQLLRARLEQAPGDGTVLRLLAETLYWAKEQRESRVLYERGLTLHPEDLQLRVDYGRMLVETADAGRARALLEPLISTAQASHALTLLGTLAYWQGDWSGAVRSFRAALAADPSATRARELWREIAASTAPWTRVAGDVASDNQPLRSLGALVEAGAYVTPLWSVGLRGRGQGMSSRSIPSTSYEHLEVFTSATLARLRVDAAGGALRRHGASDAIGQVAARVDVAGPLSLGARGERRPYVHTIASLSTPILVDEVAALVSLESATGWLGEAALARQRFPDANTIQAAHAWVLAPIVRRSGGSLQLGYALSREDARELRFVLADTSQVVPPTNPGFSLAGRYAPYYTPDNLISHAAIGALTMRAGPATSFTLDGSYAVHATDRAPFWLVAGAPPVLTLGSYERSLHPARTRARWQQRIGTDVIVEANAAWLRTIYYDARSVGLSITWRRAGAAMRRVDGR